MKKFETAIIKPQLNKEQLEFKDARSAQAGVDRIRKDVLNVQDIDQMSRMKQNHEIAMAYSSLDN